MALGTRLFQWLQSLLKRGERPRAEPGASLEEIDRRWRKRLRVRRSGTEGSPFYFISEFGDGGDGGHGGDGGGDGGH